MGSAVTTRRLSGRAAPAPLCPMTTLRQARHWQHRTGDKWTSVGLLTDALISVRNVRPHSKPSVWCPSGPASGFAPSLTKVR